MPTPDNLYALCDTNEGINVLPWVEGYHDAYADACEQRPGYAANDDMDILSMTELASFLLPHSYA
jgi:hypothetical protein